MQAEEKKKNTPEEMREDLNIAECLQRSEAKVKKIKDQFQKQLDSVRKANMEKLLELERKMTKIEDSMSVPTVLSAICATLVEQFIRK